MRKSAKSSIQMVTLDPSMTLFLPFSKVETEADGSVVFEAIATSEALDTQNEIVQYEASVKAFGEWTEAFIKATDGQSLGNIRAMHQPIAAGKAIAWSADDRRRQISLTGKVVDADSARKVRERVYTGLSIAAPGPSVTRVTRDLDGRKVGVITDYRLAEVSLVDKPANPEAIVTMVKRDLSKPQGAGHYGPYGATFDECVSRISSWSENPEGFCNWIHQQFQGVPPGVEDADGPGKALARMYDVLYKASDDEDEDEDEDEEEQEEETTEPPPEVPPAEQTPAESGKIGKGRAALEKDLNAAREMMKELAATVKDALAIYLDGEEEADASCVSMFANILTDIVGLKGEFDWKASRAVYGKADSRKADAEDRAQSTADAVKRAVADAEDRWGKRYGGLEARLKKVEATPAAIGSPARAIDKQLGVGNEQNPVGTTVAELRKVVDEIASSLDPQTHRRLRLALAEAALVQR